MGSTVAQEDPMVVDGIGSVDAHHGILLCARYIRRRLLGSCLCLCVCIPKSNNCYQTPGLVRNNSLPAQVILCRPSFSHRNRRRTLG